MSLIDLSHDRDARRACKRPVDLEVEFATDDGTLATREGPVNFRRGDALITGTEGERWPVSRERFDETYEAAPPLRPGKPGRYRKRPLLVWAKLMRAPFRVDLDGERGSLHGNEGDWLVQYAPRELGVVSAKVFAQTYELLD